MHVEQVLIQMENFANIDFSTKSHSNEQVIGIYYLLLITLC